VGARLRNHLDGILAGAGDADHAQIALELQQCGERTAQHRLVVHDHQADRLGIRHQVTATRVPPAFAAVTSSTPPPVVARSRMPRTPLPSPPEGPRPSSVTVKLPGAMVTVTVRAAACRSTLVVASRRIQLAV